MSPTDALENWLLLRLLFSLCFLNFIIADRCHDVCIQPEGVFGRPRVHNGSVGSLFGTWLNCLFCPANFRLQYRHLIPNTSECPPHACTRTHLHMQSLLCTVQPRRVQRKTVQLHPFSIKATLDETQTHEQRCTRLSSS